MDNYSHLSLPYEKCMKCGVKCNNLLSSLDPRGGVIERCDHKFCQSCFRSENMGRGSSSNHIFNCPCCHAPFCENMLSIDEAILIAEAATLSNYVYPQLSPKNTALTVGEAMFIAKINKLVVEKLEAALNLNPANFHSLYLLLISCGDCYKFLITHTTISDSINEYYTKLFECSYKLLDHPAVSGRYEFIQGECYYAMALIFMLHLNYPAALKHAKLAYEHCLRSSDHTQIDTYKNWYIKMRANIEKLPPLRFAVGDEVEFLHEFETGSEWRLGKVVELYYRERDFDISISAPYRLELLEDSDYNCTDRPCVYACVKADHDRYVRKVGVRSIEDTRYQARLDAKVTELARVYCSEGFLQEVYHTLAQDLEFVEMLQSYWQVKLVVPMLILYRMLVMCRQTLMRIDSGYHVPSSEEVIAGIKAYFHPTHLSGDAAPLTVDEGSDTQESEMQRVRAEVLRLLRGTNYESADSFGDPNLSAQWALVQGIRNYSVVLVRTLADQEGFAIDALGRRSNFTVSSEMSEAISRVSTLLDVRRLLGDHNDAFRLELSADASLDKRHYSWTVRHYLHTWAWLLICLENPDAGSACECPFVYFFVKFCLDRALGVPKLALSVYDRMNMQLSREFIRCASPSCEHNRLDQSINQVKFKLCSRCKTVIYCSRECQVAHYPEHKRLCREHSTGREGS